MILTHIGPDDPVGLHHILPTLAGFGSAILVYVYLFWMKVLDIAKKLREAVKKLFCR